MKLELLAPAKNLEFGREAVNHGADALYIGAPAFGARAAATNSLEDIEALVRYAHLYCARVFATVNTLLFDDELDAVVDMIRRLYNIGVDALILQDLGLLECDLPPIELHASTQCHNASVERVKFMESVGFKRVILARETSLEQMRALREATSVDLEAFVHGALCVSYSGQCYMSQYLSTAKVERGANPLASPRQSSVGVANSRSGNRGCCSQPCRSRYDLLTSDGRVLLKDRHLLSLRDFNASSQLQAMVEAGITSFKIEGRLKDLSYVKNITAYYRQLLDTVVDGHQQASSGRCVYTFTPDPDRTFNRGYTDYFLRNRQSMANFATQKSLGKRVGEVVSVGRNALTVNAQGITFTPGDGLCYFASDGTLQGFLVNHVQGNTLVPNQMPLQMVVGTPLWRNHDQAFERQLQGNTAVRKIECTLVFDAVADGFALTLRDSDGLEATARVAAPHDEANNRQRSAEQNARQLTKLGDTPFSALAIDDRTQGRYFLPAATLNQLRRDAVAALIDRRLAAFRPHDVPLVRTDTSYPVDSLDYRANVINQRSEAFYRRHGVKEIERGLEQTLDYEGHALMTTKYCLRYELGSCLQGKNSRTAPSQPPIRPSDTLLLRNNENLFRLEFDCRQCLMRIYRQKK